MPFTRLGEAGYGVRRAGDFSGKTPSGGGGGGAHPVGVLTRFSMDGYGARRAGSFSGKTPSGGGGGGGAHPVSKITRFGLEGYGVRRASFSAKTPATSTAGVVGLFAYWVGGAGAGTTPTPTPTPTGQVGAEPISNWQVRHKRRLTEDELRELIREQRIALGILDKSGQGIGEPADIAKEVAEAVHNEIVMAEIPIDYRTIYREAFLEAERAIAQYKKRKRRRAIAAILLSS